MKRIKTLVWGSVRTNGEKYYLLKEEPESPYKSPKWQPEDTLRWLVAEVNNYIYTSKDIGDLGVAPVYKASYVVFGRNAVVELLDDPQTEILVDYFSSEDENENVA